MVFEFPSVWISGELRYVALVVLISRRDPYQDTLRVLVATDTHLGYMEKDEVRGLDSFNAFDEVCAIAAEKEVRFLPFCSGNRGLCCGAEEKINMERLIMEQALYSKCCRHACNLVLHHIYLIFWSAM